MKVTDALGNVGYFYTDAAGRVTLQVDPEGAVTQTQYDGLGNPVSIRRYSVTVTGSLDAETLPSVDSSASDQLETISYDTLGRKTIVKTWFGTGTSDFYTESYTYTAFGDIYTQTARNGQVTTYTYDKQSKRLSESFAGITVRNAADNGTITLKNSYTYNAFGNLLTKVEADGALTTRTTAYVNDKLGRQVQTSQNVQTTASSSVLATTQKNYDARGNIVAEKDANNYWTYFYYDKQDRRIATAKGDGSYTIWEYDALGNTSKETRYANKVQVRGTAVLSATSSVQLVGSAPTTGNVVYLVTDAVNDRITTYSYDKVGRQTGSKITSVTTGAYNTVTQQYQYGTNDISTATEYDALGNVIKQTDGNGNVTRNWYNRAGQAIAKLDAEGYLTLWTRDVYGNIAQETRYANKVQTTGTATLDSGIPNVVTVVPTGNSVYVLKDVNNDRTTVISYDKLNRVVSENIKAVAQGEINAVNGVLTPDVGTNKVVTGSLDTANLSVNGLTDINQVALSSGDILYSQTYVPGNAQSQYAPGLVQRSQTVNLTMPYDELIGGTKTEYNAAGDIVKVTDALGNVGYFYTDAAGRVTLQVDPEGAVTQTQYDGLGNVTQVLRFANKVQTSGTGVLSTGASIQVVSTAPGGNSVYVLTDAAKDQKQTTEYDKLGQKLTVKTWTGATTGTATTDYYTEGYTYTAFGDVQTQTARNGQQTVYTYDKQGRKLSESFTGITVRNAANNGTVTLKNSYTYNAFGNLLSKIEADGALTTRTTTYTNDKLGRQQQTSQVVQTTTGATGSAMTQKTYDARGNVVAEKDANNNWTYSYYDKQDRRIASVKADGSYTTWTYDAVGNISQQTQYANKVQTIGSATLSASSSIQLVSTAPTSGNVVYLLTDAANDRTTLYTYDKVGRQTGTEIQNITTGVYNTASNQYQVSTGSITTKTEYDALGNIIKQTDGNGNVTRSWYNKAGQLVAKLDPENYLTVWTRDVYGNISQETRYANKVQTIGTATYTDSGIPTIVTTAPTTGNSVYVLQDNTNDRTTILNYDKLNRVSSETVNNVQAGSVNATTGVLTNPTAVNATTSYQYDGLNNIIQKTDATSAITNWIYDGLGRQLSEINPQFVDYQNNTVRSRTDKEYDGLNNVTRE